MGKFVSKNGKYQTGKTSAAMNTGEKQKSGKKTILIIGIVLLLLIIGIVIAVVLYMNSLMGLMTNKNPETYPTMSDEEIHAMLHPEGVTNATDVTDATDVTETTAETSPEDTWPVIESDENLTHIMVVGQAAREDENYKLADSMILCTINRETKTLTMTSFMRDMYVTIPAYWGHTQGGNKMNVVYHLGYHYGGDGMEMLEICMEQNFGIKVDHTVEIDFEIFQKVINMMGGVQIELTEKEAYHMTHELNDVGTFEPGMNTLNGWQALNYARIRKIDSDFKRTERQKNVITSLINSFRNMGIMDIHAMATEVLPMIKTNMSTTEMWNYAFEFIPMLKDLKLESITIPQDVNWWSENLGSEEAPHYVLKCNMKDVNALLRERLGIVDEETK